MQVLEMILIWFLKKEARQDKKTRQGNTHTNSNKILSYKFNKEQKHALW